jgi:two-component system, chemotaxis family, CheB/CheR fusion protein
MAFVLVQHLDPTHPSLLTELLSRATTLPVRQVTNGTVIQPNHVYIIPPDSDMFLAGHMLKLQPRSIVRGQHMPVDVFLRSLAEAQRHQAIGMILSGTASDGSLGIQAIRAHGGITMAQDEHSSKHSGMPRSAVLTGCVDYVLPPEELARELARIGRHAIIKPEEELQELAPQAADLTPILELLRTSTGVDFAKYKINTVNRRILRRMALHKFDRLDQYATFLQSNPLAVQDLYQDLLIKVTSFFRDPPTFAALQRDIFPKLLEKRPNGSVVRVWVPGCATGEEAYSVAMALLESLDNRATPVPIQIFATDISEEALSTARQGIYVENIALDVSPARLRRFFVEVDRGYQMTKAVRDVCIFAKQDLTRDPPFSNLDLISCRNMLIYLGRPIQQKVFPVFHYALKPGGYLVLGTSESIGNFSNLFSVADKKYQIFIRKASLSPPGLYFTTGHPTDTTEARRSVAVSEEANGREVQKEADRIVLSKYTPPGVIINEQMDILQFRGRTSPYLEPSPGKPSLNLLKMVREGLLVDLRAVFQKAKKTGRPCGKQGIPIKYNGGYRNIALEVLPLKNHLGEEAYYLVLFKEPSSEIAEDKKGVKASPRKNIQFEHLKQELRTTKESLEMIIEEREDTNQELQSANEEILSSNEELQSTNEEMETAKEELQSTNEELTTVNEEMQNRNQELTLVNDDLMNLMAAVNIPVVMLGNDLRIRHFTPMAQSILKLIPADIGRPLTDINHNLRIPHLDQILLEVISTGSIREQEVQDQGGHWYSMRVRPSRTSANRIDGGVIVLVDIDAFKGSLEDLRESRDYAESIIESIWEPLVVLDDQLRVMTANRAFFSTFRVAADETRGSCLFDLGNGQWNIPTLRTMLESLIPQNGRFHDFEVEHEFPRLGRRTMLLNARVIFWEKQRTQMVLLTLQDITQRKEAELDRMKAMLREKEVLLKEIHHRVKNNLQIISSLLRLQFDTQKSKSANDVFKESQNRIRSMALIHEKLYHSQDLSKIDFSEYVRNLASNLFLSYGVDPARIELEVKVEDVSWDVGTAIPCGLIINELISNALKYAFPENRPGNIRIELRREQDRFRLSVADDGVGLPKDVDFRRTESLGFQLVGMLTEQLNGTVDVHADGKTEICILFPPPKEEETEAAAGT